MPINIFWFRRDLRLHDNHGLFRALEEGHPVLPIFIFDTEILDHLPSNDDARVTFIYDTIATLKSVLQSHNSDLLVYNGKPIEIWKNLIDSFQIHHVYTNHDYESYAISRDERVQSLLAQHNISFHTYKDHVIFEKKEIVKEDGNPYTVFTSYKNKWLKRWNEIHRSSIKHAGIFPFEMENHFTKFYIVEKQDMPPLASLGFLRSEIKTPSTHVASSLIKSYHENRDYPAKNGTSRLGIHFRFGTISIREKALKASLLNDTFLNELIWRDFYVMILYNFPHVEKGAFRPEYDQILWRNDENEFQSWCEGKTGYPLVDAGMRELKATGFMHNRVRMVTASFLTKHLLIDWRWGEIWFANHLLDFDLASNNGGWQWAAGCGTDAAPYFRIFNPSAQAAKFDNAAIYIKKWVPEYGTNSYPTPIVDHKQARQRCLETYKEALNRKV